ncbi:MAG: M20/M25/M40 family metallo-hydrolase, partial [Schwartzia sp.]|nr:M20/M25/M40 family metallo-hydrolase [Schwartzia sp. (in: firmicutes)]
MQLDKEILQHVNQMKEALVARRRDLHRHPEPGWTEFRTAALAAAELERLGYEVKTGEDAVARGSMMGLPPENVLREAQARAIREGAPETWVNRMTGGLTGVVATMRFDRPGPVVGLRFDMDANDVSETTDADHVPNQQGFASLHPGAMHACGHDGHTTVGLAVAEILAGLRDRLAGTVKLVFQPA